MHPLVSVYDTATTIRNIEPTIYTRLCPFACCPVHNSAVNKFIVRRLCVSSVVNSIVVCCEKQPPLHVTAGAFNTSLSSSFSLGERHKHLATAVQQWRLKQTVTPLKPEPNKTENRHRSKTVSPNAIFRKIGEAHAHSPKNPQLPKQPLIIL